MFKSSWLIATIVAYKLLGRSATIFFMSKEIAKSHEAIIAELKKIRIAKGYSHYKVAELASLHRTAIGHIESGKRNPTLLTCLRIAKALDIDLGKIITKKQH